MSIVPLKLRNFLSRLIYPTKNARCTAPRKESGKFWKGFVNVSLIFRNLLAGLVLVTFLGGCATVKPNLPRPRVGSAQKPAKPPKPLIKKRSVTSPTPKPTDSQRTVALLSLVDQGRTYLDQKRPDAAIRVLERAININPQRGESYYYLAQAWLMKENFSQAREYNRLAGNYLGNDPQWAGLVAAQRQKIDRQEKG